MEIKSGRRQQVDYELKDDRLNDSTELSEAIAYEEKRLNRKLSKRQDLEENSMSFYLIKQISKYLDDYLLDPFIGLIPVIGDALTGVFVLPFIYVSLFKVRSIPLTLAVLYNTSIDVLAGIIPFLGIFIDAFNKSFNKNRRLIMGFVDGDREIIQTVNRGALKMVLLIAVIIYLTYLLVQLVELIYETVMGFF